MKAIIALALFTQAAHCAQCLPLTTDRIFARDLAAADPSFAGMQADQVIGFAPAPGVKRIINVPELWRIARANGIVPSTSEEVCFEIPMRSIAKEDLVSAMRRSLPPDSEVTVIDFSPTAFPAGAVEFPLTGLEPALPNAKGLRIWRGSIKYGDTLRAPISARVDVRRRISAVVTVAAIPRNSGVDAAHLRVETVSVPLDRVRGLARNIEEVAGGVAKSDLAAGSPVPMSAVEKPMSVHRGDPVVVEVLSGRARIRIDAVAEISARAGEMLDLRNPSSGKVFRARLEDGGRAVVVVRAGQGL